MNKHVLYILLLIPFLRLNAQTNGSATQDYIHFYQEFLSTQKNSRCAMYPSCSQYAISAFKEFSFLKAMIFTSDRLIRCSHDANYYESTYITGKRSFIDFIPNKKVPTSIINKRFPKPYTKIFKLTSSRDTLSLFIDELINKGKYDLALLEIERELFLKKANTRLYIQKLICHRGLQDYENGIYDYETVYPNYAKNNNSIKQQAALLYYCAGNLEEASTMSEEIISIGNSTNEMDKTYGLKGIIATQHNNYNEARKYFSLIKELPIRQSSIQLLQQLEISKKKNPSLAKVLSIIPGGGYLYTGHKGSALTSFLINTLLAYATYTSIKSENYGMAGVCGFMGLSFYIGNINGAGRSARRYNQSQKNKYIKKLEQIYISNY